MYKDDIETQKRWEKIHDLISTPPPENTKGPASEEELSNLQDRLTNPDHYSFPGGAEVIDIVKHLDFLRGNAVKYLCRAGRKEDTLTDLLKAQRYVEWAIEKERENES